MGVELRKVCMARLTLDHLVESQNRTIPAFRCLVIMVITVILPRVCHGTFFGTSFCCEG